VIEKAVKAHVRRAEEEKRDPNETMSTCIKQIARLLGRLAEN
jgi:hypothetical protein